MSPRFVTVKVFSPSRRTEGETLVVKTWGSLPSKEVSPREIPFNETLRWCSSSTSASEAPWRTTWSWVLSAVRSTAGHGFAQHVG